MKFAVMKFALGKNPLYISGSDLNHVALDNSMSQTVCTGQKKPAATKGEIQQL